ncbi:NADH:ubiquinone reductase (Na(+)-transporting) subunit F [bacterium]|nr:NADH:ubiquinone reductase (Na(+)-transporting) subunit F [bacterium]
MEPPAREEFKPGRYSLVGENSRRAVELGLAEAEWYTSPISREVLRELLERRDGPPLRDTFIWVSALALFGGLGYALWPSPLALLPFLAYSVLYRSTAVARWHETGHGTAFRTDWLNVVMYHITSFMIMREPHVAHWSHTRHHSDTTIVGRDPEIGIPRPPNPRKVLYALTGFPQMRNYFNKMKRYSLGNLNKAELTFVPESEHRKIFRTARIHLTIYALVILSCVYFWSLLPLFYVGLPGILGAWLAPIFSLTQHAGLAENVLDHRLNCRTILMNPISCFHYWNMNYHVEHHMFPQVPYYNLPRLFELVKHDMPEPYHGLWEAWREIITTMRRQLKDPAYFVKRRIPTPTIPHLANVAAKTIVCRSEADAEGWVRVCGSDELDFEDVLRFDHAARTYALYRAADGRYYATVVICTHGNTHLATGFMKGHVIECAKHGGRFDVRDGSPRRAPVCVALRTYPVRESDGNLYLNVSEAEDQGRRETRYRFRVLRNQNVATVIKELVVELTDDSPPLEYRPGQHVQMLIPPYERISFRDLDVCMPYAEVWEAQHVFDFEATNPTALRRNLSLAGNPAVEKRVLRFNVRIATPPRGQDCSAGAGSSYLWSLRPGDTLTAVGPFGDFLIKDTNREMVYLGGGSGMAPLRSHLSYLFETLKTGRRVSYWYGARARQELFYLDYFQDLAARFPNFSFHPALSEPLPDDAWDSHTGLIHEVLSREYLAHHPDPTAIEYYLCGPQPMVVAARRMLSAVGVPPEQIAFDEF